MGSSPQAALALSILAAVLASFLAAGAMRWFRIHGAWADLLLPAVFLGAYYLVYNKVPSFPPVGAVNKVFYLAAAGTILGFLVDLWVNLRLARVLVLLQPVAAAVYIGAARLTEGPIEVAAAAGSGLLAIALLSRDTGGSAEETGLRRALLLAIFCLGFAPVALLGASSSSFQLCLIFAFATFASLIWNLTNPSYSFGTASLLGAAGGLISVAYTVALITRKTDLLAMAVLCLILLVPLLSDRVLSALTVKHTAARLSIFTLLCTLPALSAAGIAILSYGSNFPI